MLVCFVGIGSIAQRHIKNLVQVLKNTDLEIDVLRHSTGILPDDIKKYIRYEYHHFSKLNKEYDAIFITNPTSLHYETIKTLKNYSKHFFVEKPAFSDLSKSLDSLKLPPENIYYVACPLRYSKVLEYAKKIACESPPFSVRAISSSYLPDWRPGTDYRKCYSSIKEQGGGVCIDLIHEWDYLCDIFGEPHKVYSFFGKYSNLEITSDDIAIYIAQYKGFLLELHLDYFGRKAERNVTFYCSDGVYVFDILNSCVYKNGEIIKQYTETVNDKYIQEIKYFLELCNFTKENRNNLQRALRTQSIAMCEWG